MYPLNSNKLSPFNVSTLLIQNETELLNICLFIYVFIGGLESNMKFVLTVLWTEKARELWVRGALYGALY